jgi:YggT family protein
MWKCRRRRNGGCRSGVTDPDEPDVLNFGSGHILYDLGEIYVLILLVRAVLSWFPYNPNSPLDPVRRVVFTLTEPVLAPFRRLIPPIGMLDISFLIAVIVVQVIVSDVLGRIAV